jgi:hypothetical protein
MVCADDVNLLVDNIDNIKKNTQTLNDVSEEVGLEVNAEKIKYMLLSYHQSAGQNHDTKIHRVQTQADWTLNLPSATSYESDGSLAQKNSAARPVQVGHIVYFFR